MFKAPIAMFFALIKRETVNEIMIEAEMLFKEAITGKIIKVEVEFC